MNQPSNVPTADNNDETLPSSEKQKKKVQFDDELGWDDETTHKTNIDDDQSNRRRQIPKRHTKNQLKNRNEIDQLNEDRKRRKQEKMNRQIEQLTWMVDNWQNLLLEPRDILNFLAQRVEDRNVSMNEVPTILQGILDDVDRHQLLSDRDLGRILTWAYLAASRQGTRGDGRLIPLDDDAGDTASESDSQSSSNQSRTTDNVAAAAAAANAIAPSLNVTTEATTTTITNNDNTTVVNNENNDNTDAAGTTNQNNNENKKPWWRRLSRRR